MNPFSQSKLTLKLKKQTSSISTDHTKKCENSEISESLKSKCLLSNSVASENDSFVEILHTQSHNEKNPMSKTSLLDQNISNKINKNKQCPICFHMLDDKSFTNHVKSCAASHNLSSKILIEALNLHERQVAERLALGLPKCNTNQDIKKKRCHINKQSKSKIGSDSNLDLAIAMSVSLQESKEAEIIKESETLLEAGLEEEAMYKRKTLENFGFVSTQPVKSKSKISSKTNSLLFKQTKEDREKRITEKVAMILIDSDIDTSLSQTLINYSSTSKLGSTYLNKIRNIDNKLWKKSLLDTKSDKEFYVSNLSKFIKPCEINHFLESNTDNKELIDTLNTVKDNLNLNSVPIKSNNIIEKKILSDYSAKWKSMVGNQFMSDITVFVKDEHKIPAHSLVLYVQCPDILDDVIIEESDTSKSKKMLMWLEYSYEATLAFLKLIYSGQESSVSLENRKDYLLLGTRYNIVIAINNDENLEWFSEEHCETSKRKNEDGDSTNYKRYKASSPDMFTSNDISVDNYTNTNFLGKFVNDEKSSSVLKTQQWLDSCYGSSSQNHLSFTENLNIDIPPLTVSAEKSPSHSIHSALTVCLPLNSPSNYSDVDDHNNYLPPDISSASPKSVSSNGSSVKAILVLNTTKDIPSTSTPLAKISTLKIPKKQPEIITINSDSDSGSVDMILSNNMITYRKSNIFKKNYSTFLSNFKTTNEKKNFIPKPININIDHGKNIDTIELNDDSSDSIHSACTNVLYQGNLNTNPIQPLGRVSSASNLRTDIINIDDENSVFSAATNLLHFNNSLNTQVLSNNNNNFIDLVEDSSDSLSTINRTGLFKDNALLNPICLSNDQHNKNSTSFSNVNNFKMKTSCQFNLKTDNLTQNPSCSTSTITNVKSDKNFDLDPANSSNNRILPESNDNLKYPGQSFQLNNVSECLNIVNYTPLNDIENNRKYLDEKNKSHTTSSAFGLLENTIENKSLKLLSSNHGDIHKTSMEIANSYVSGDYINKYTLINPNNIQDNPNELSRINIACKKTLSYENELEKDQSIFEQIIDDPWVSYLQSVDNSPQYILSNTLMSTNESEVQTLNGKNIHPTCLNLQISPTTNSNGSTINYQNNNALTPNKYDSRMNTPKSLHRIISESIIGSNEQVTPLPDFSSMETPDFRKQFDRYGLKDLGKSKGKLLLRHIYNLLHPSVVSEIDKWNLELESYSDSSDSSEHGIPDYEDENDDELETFSQINLSNKTSVEIGFKQLLKVNESLHKKILCYEPIWIEELKEELKQLNVNISLQKLTTFLDDKCITFRSKSINDQKQKTLAKKNTKRKKLF